MTWAPLAWSPLVESNNGDTPEKSTNHTKLPGGKHVENELTSCYIIPKTGGVVRSTPPLKSIDEVVNATKPRCKENTRHTVAGNGLNSPAVDDGTNVRATRPGGDPLDTKSSENGATHV